MLLNHYAGGGGGGGGGRPLVRTLLFGQNESGKGLVRGRLCKWECKLSRPTRE